MLRFFLPLFAFAVGPTLAFTTTLHNNGVASRMTTSSSLRLTEAEIPVEAMTSRGDCVFWFFGASGAAGIARSAFPMMFDKYVGLQKLKDVGPTKGGEMFGLNPLICGIPQDIAKADVLDVVSNKLTIEELVKKYPVENNFLSAKGYLCLEAFEEANAGKNPLAVRTIFDSMSAGTGTIDPELAQRKVDLYKENLGAFKFDVVKAKWLGLLAIVTLLFLLGIADIIAFTDVKDGWFPDWPGGENFPFGMFKEGGSPTNIPNYWI